MAMSFVWNGNPFSVYALADFVFIDGALRYDRSNPALTPQSDFTLVSQPLRGYTHESVCRTRRRTAADRHCCCRPWHRLIRNATVHTVSAAGVLEHTIC